MNLGLLISPFISGLVYERLGYFPVFAIVLGVIAVDLILRLLMIEKGEAAKWIPIKESQTQAAEDGYMRNPSAEWVRQGNVTEPDGHQPDANEETPLLPKANSRNDKQQKSWIRREFPTAVRIFSSKRLRAAFYGGFIHTVIITAFDTTLPLFVKDTFGWNSEAVGILFFAITIPSLLGPLVGWLSDRYGARKTTLFGFFLTVPALGCMAIVHHNKLFEKVLLVGLLALLGAGLSFILSPLAADIFDEATAIAEGGDSNEDETGMFAQSYCIFNAVLGLAAIVGPGLPGLFDRNTVWPGVLGVLTAMVAVGGLQVFRHTGKRILSKGGDA
jgi:MFS family permease